MGTRADFYVGRGDDMQWIGSIAWDGYPDGIKSEILTTANEDEFRAEVLAFIASRDDGTKPEMGWPWPWNTSSTTDYAYAFDGGEVFASCFGSPWWLAANEQPEEGEGSAPNFPDMQSIKRTDYGDRSGVIFVEI